MSLLSWVYAFTFWVLVGWLSPGPWPVTRQDRLASSGAGWHEAGQEVTESAKEGLLDG